MNKYFTSINIPVIYIHTQLSESHWDIDKYFSHLDNNFRIKE